MLRIVSEEEKVKSSRISRLVLIDYPTTLCCVIQPNHAVTVISKKGGGLYVYLITEE